MATKEAIFERVSVTIIDEAAEAIISARDFCGDEREAVADVLADHGIRDREARNWIWREASASARKTWDDFRTQAGVVPSL